MALSSNWTHDHPTTTQGTGLTAPAASPYPEPHAFPEALAKPQPQVDNAWLDRLKERLQTLLDRFIALIPDDLVISNGSSDEEQDGDSTIDLSAYIKGVVVQLKDVVDDQVEGYKTTSEEEGDSGSDEGSQGDEGSEGGEGSESDEGSEGGEGSEGDEGSEGYSAEDNGSNEGGESFEEDDNLGDSDGESNTE